MAHSYDSFNEKLDELPHLKRRKLANNTYLRRAEDGTIVIRLHQTDIIRVLPENLFVLNSGGWQTITTKERMNRFTPARIWQIKHVWYLSPEKTPFFDGIIVDATGTPVNADTRQVALAEKENAWLEKSINRMIAKLRKMRDVPMPEPGDCWGCHFVAEDGSHPMGYDCILSHLKENYLHGSLIVRALRSRGYSDFPISLYYDRWKHDDKWARDTICRALRGFLREQGRKLLAQQREAKHGNRT